MIERILVFVCIGILSIVSVGHGEPFHHTISVTTTDFQFVPNIWTIRSGQKTSLELINNSVQEHEWVLLKEGTKVTLPFNEDDEDKVFWEIEAKSGTTQKGTFTAPWKPGTYTVVCGKPRHIERGMTATLIVE